MDLGVHGPPREVARTESPRGELVLRERHGEAAGVVVELRVNGLFVMDTLETSAERVLATAALDLLDPSDPSATDLEVLVGGLGLGFTAHQVLADPRVRRCRVVEIEDVLVRWMRDGTVPHGPGLVADERLEVVVGDVAEVVTEARPSTYHLVLLDTDNGPDQLVHQANARLYEPGLLAAVRRALRPGGVAAIWSAAAAPRLEAVMAEVFGDVLVLPLPVVLQGRDETYWIYAGQV